MRIAPALALALIGAAFALPLQPPGCAQTSHFALVRSLERGAPEIDRYHWQTCDKSWFEGHFFSAKGPGLAFASLPYYAALDAAGLAWDGTPSASDPSALYSVPRSAIWPLTLWAVALPALLLVFLMRWASDRVVPGYGTATAVALGLGTLILPYATLYSSHLLAVTCAFAAFTLIWKERDGPPRLTLVLFGGALAGFAIAVDNPLGLVTVALGLYAISGTCRLRKALAYGAGSLAGILPLLLFNQWAFGDATHQAYENAVIAQGDTGHDVIGANTPGLFGITSPSLDVAIELLFSRKGLLVITPVVALAAAGLSMLYRQGRRAEALLGAGISIAYLVYNASYYLPFGGDSAGPRFLIPVLPFLAVPLALMLKRFPLTSGALALLSVGTMVIATATQPMLGHLDTRVWGRRFIDGDFTETALSLAGAGHGWVAILPFLAVVVGAAGAAAATLRGRTLRRRDAEVLAAAVGAWAVVATAGPALLESGLPHPTADAAVIATAAVVGLATWCVAARYPGRAWRRAAEPRRKLAR